MTFKHCLWSHTFVFRCRIWPDYIFFSLLTFVWQRQTWRSRIACGLHIFQMASPWTGRIDCGLCTLHIHYRLWTTFITFVLRTTTRWHCALHVAITFGLHNGISTSHFAFSHCLLPAKNSESMSNVAVTDSFVLHTMSCQRLTLPT